MVKFPYFRQCRHFDGTEKRGFITNMKKKTYRIPEETERIIQNLMQEKNFTSENAALIYIVDEFEKRKSLADEIADSLIERDKKFRERLRWATRTAELNSQMLLDAVNTILWSKKYENCCMSHVLMNPVLEQSKQSIERRIEHFKQEKDNRERKNNL